MSLRYILLASSLFLASASHAQAGPPAKKKLNIICIVTDDQAAWSVGAYGNRQVVTPNMDRLAREGALFRNAFVTTPVCSPSRASYLTGRYGTQVRITDWISPREAAGGVGVPEVALTWPEVLRRQGYLTALIGKWHLGMLPRFHPTRNGFDHFFGFVGGGAAPMNPVMEENGKERKMKGYGGDLLTDNAIEFITKNKAKSFAMCLHFREPHAPYAPTPPEDAAVYKDLDPKIPAFKGLDVAQVKKLTREYYAAVHSVDRNLGRLLKALEELGLLEDTIIVFTSDHGYCIGHHGIWHKGNGIWIVGGVNGPRRPNMFDVNLRVPLMIRWPRVIRPGTVVEQMVSNIDTFPTVLGMLGVPRPKDYRQEGADFSPILRGEKTPWREEVFSQYDIHNSAQGFMRSIRTPRWHLVRYCLANDMDELYDIENDPGEMKNLIRNPKHQETASKLRTRLDAWMRSIDDPVLRLEAAQK